MPLHVYILELQCQLYIYCLLQFPGIPSRQTRGPICYTCAKQQSAEQCDVIAMCGIDSVYDKTCLKRQLKKKTKMFFNIDYRLMQVKSIAECPKGSKGSILQCFRPSLSYNLSLRFFVLSFFERLLKTGLLYYSLTSLSSTISFLKNEDFSC